MVIKRTNASFLLRVDSGFSIGYGHRTRAEAIAKYLHEVGYDYRFCSRRIPGARKDLPELNGTLWLSNDIGEYATRDLDILDAEATIETSKRYNFWPDIVFVDNYKLGPTWEVRMRREGFYVVSLDDFKDKPHASNLVIELLPEDCSSRRLSGLKYIPVDKAFEDESTDFKWSDLSVLVTFGGGDPTGHTVVVLKALFECIREIPDLIARVDVVLTAKKTRENKKLIDDFNIEKFVFHEKLPSLAPLIKSSSLVITSGGNTVIEALVAKRPVMAVVTADNQEVVSNYLNSKGLLFLLGRADNVGVQEIKVGLVNMENKLKLGMAQAIKTNKFDSRGARRIVASVLSGWKARIT